MHCEIPQQAVVDVVDPAVDGEGLAACPGLLHDGRVAHVAQPDRSTFSSQRRSICASSAFSSSSCRSCRSRTSCTWRSQLSMRPSDDREIRRTHPAAAVVAAHDDVLDLEHVDRVLQHRQAVQIGVHDDVGDVAVDEQLARPQADDLVGRHAAVRAADPQVLRQLLRRQRPEEVGIVIGDAAGPAAVVVEKVGEVVHASRDVTAFEAASP